MTQTMTWDYPYKLGGPVLAWELHRGRQRGEAFYLGMAFFVLCALHFTVTTISFEKNLETNFNLMAQSRQFTWQDRLSSLNEQKMLHAAQYLGRFFPLQLFVLMLITPALSAGALGQEKEKDTLTALFGTELADHEIVRGKVLGRYWQLVRFILFSMPLVCIVAGVAQVPLQVIALCYLHALVITFSLAGICIFSAVITRRTRDAIMACYSIIIIITLVSLTILGEKPLPTWLNPVEVAIGLSAYPFSSIKPWTLVVHLLTFFGLGWFFVRLSCWLIRPAGLRQLEDRSSRWRWSVRRNISDDPVRWRERHILGIAPLPALRSIPSWLGALGCMAFSISMIGGLINTTTHGRFAQLLLQLKWNEALVIVSRLSKSAIESDTILMGVILILFSGITILIRCAGSLNEEKRMKTWDDLQMTAIPVRDIANSKMWGILQASLFYIVCYALPMLAFSLLAGKQGYLPAIITIGLALFVVFIAANIGMGMSLASVSNRTEVQQIPLSRKRTKSYTIEIID